MEDKNLFQYLRSLMGEKYKTWEELTEEEKRDFILKNMGKSNGFHK